MPFLTPPLLLFNLLHHPQTSAPRYDLVGGHGTSKFYYMGGSEFGSWDPSKGYMLTTWWPFNHIINLNICIF
ncbi:hypothetical protein EDC01DRAFT_652140 [Geopyxis carbonaria]|nr:hypothetical protein EDC01DRAFT_652140 [Geopyxis carbonaria]